LFLDLQGQKSKGPEVASFLDDLKKKLADRKNGITAEKPEKAEVPQRKAKDKKKVVPEVIPAPPLKRSIQEVVKCEEAKKPASVQKKPAPQKKKNQPSKVKTPKVPKKQEPRPIPAWWNDKQELLRSFPEDTEKRFASRCYHFVRKNEMRKGVSKDLATLTAQRAHQEAKDRWPKLFPNA
jgi:outer membrane biosynthesis protein TonB